MCIGRKVEKKDNDDQKPGLTRHDVLQSTRDKFLDQYPQGSLEDANNFAYGCLDLFDMHCEDIKDLPDDEQEASKGEFLSGLMNAKI